MTVDIKSYKPALIDIHIKDSNNSGYCSYITIFKKNNIYRITTVNMKKYIEPQYLKILNTKKYVSVYFALDKVLEMLPGTVASEIKKQIKLKDK